jgi:hypothetical protein
MCACVESECSYVYEDLRLYYVSQYIYIYMHYPCSSTYVLLYFYAHTEIRAYKSLLILGTLVLYVLHAVRAGQQPAAKNTILVIGGWILMLKMMPRTPYYTVHYFNYARATTNDAKNDRQGDLRRGKGLFMS